MRISRREQDACHICGSSLRFGDSPVIADALGVTWCRKHVHRGQNLTWAKANGWPALNCGTHAIASIKWHWLVAMIWGNDDFAWAVTAYIEYLMSEQIATKGAQ